MHNIIQHMKRPFLSILFILFVAKAFSTMSIDPQPVDSFELDKYLGTWYEIARFPHRFEKNLIGVTATYSLRDDGKISVVNNGFKKTFDGKFSSITGKAKPAGDVNIGHLKVSFFLFFYADYKILVLDPEYEYALVGSNSPNFLWILCRTPEMPEDQYTYLVNEAKKRGYDIEKLIRVEQKANSD